MTYAPACLRAVLIEARRRGASPAGLGCTPNASHHTGYHLGRDLLYARGSWGDYSSCHARDVKALHGLTKDASCAVDIGTDMPGHRAWIVALVADLKAGRPAAEGLRAINYTPDGVHAIRVDMGDHGAITPADPSHLGHSHLEWWRDEIAKSPNLVARIFPPPPTPPHPPEDDVDLKDQTVKIPAVPTPLPGTPYPASTTDAADAIGFTLGRVATMQEQLNRICAHLGI